MAKSTTLLLYYFSRYTGISVTKSPSSYFRTIQVSSICPSMYAMTSCHVQMGQHLFSSVTYEKSNCTVHYFGSVNVLNGISRLTLTFLNTSLCSCCYTRLPFTVCVGDEKSVSGPDCESWLIFQHVTTEKMNSCGNLGRAKKDSRKRHKILWVWTEFRR